MFRWLLLAPHPQFPPMAKCPGCGFALTPQEFFGHVVGCARCHGYNVSSRHAGLKKLLHEIFDMLGLSYDTHEPRAFNKYTCVGCRCTLESDEVSAHIASCERLEGLVSRDAAVDRSGPDGRVYLPANGNRRERVIVWDVTIVSTTALSHRGKSLEAAFSERTREKNGKYKGPVEAEKPGQEFAVIGGSAFGELSSSTTQLFKDCIAATNSAYSLDFITRKFSAGIAFCSGHVIAEAERRIGIVHSQSPLQAAIQPSTGRKGTAAHGVAGNDGLWVSGVESAE
jgi:hypothetical protein